jgi:hypothetical protein
MGRLSLKEKYTIQGMLHNSKSVEDIATILERSQKCVQNYIDGELSTIQNTIVQTQIEQNPTPEKVDIDKLKKLPKGQAKKTMGYKTVNNKGGVAIMNAATSAVGDDFLKELDRKKITRGAKGNLYDADGNKL